MLEIDYRNSHLCCGIRVNQVDTVPFSEMQESVVVEPISAEKGIVKLKILCIRYDEKDGYRTGYRGPDDVVTIDLNKGWNPDRKKNDKRLIWKEEGRGHREYRPELIEWNKKYPRKKKTKEQTQKQGGK